MYVKLFFFKIVLPDIALKKRGTISNRDESQEEEIVQMFTFALSAKNNG